MKGKKRRITPNYLFIVVTLYLLVSLYLKTDMAYMKFLTICILGGVISVIHLLVVKPCLSFAIKDESYVRINKKSQVELTINIQNKAWLQSPYIYIFLKPTYHVAAKQYDSICVALPPRSTKEITLEYVGEYSGKETLGIEEIVLQDYFGIMKRRIKCTLEKEVSVLPQVVALGKVENLLNLVKVKERDHEQIPVISSDGEVCHELAPYIEGDSLKLMHWKLLARRDIYMVRQREEHATIKREYVFILDPICEEQEKENRVRLIDKILVTSISLAYTFLKQGEKVTLIYKQNAMWQQLTLTEIMAIPQLAAELSGYIGNEGQVGEERWPYEYLHQHYPFPMSKVFLTSYLSKYLCEELEEKKSLNVLEMKKGPWVGESLVGTWYLTDEYEVIRYV